MTKRSAPWITHPFAKPLLELVLEIVLGVLETGRHDAIGIDPFAVTPDDPALHRLFPDAYADDEDASAEFRRFTERSLRDGKLGRAWLAIREDELAALQPQALVLHAPSVVADPDETTTGRGGAHRAPPRPTSMRAVRHS